MPGTRYRAPTSSGSPYVTAAGHARLRSELEQLWRIERPQVVSALAAAAAEGDRSENAEYQYRKRQLAGIDRRVRYLTRRLDCLKVVDGAPSDTSRVRFGAWVELSGDSDDRLYRYRLVGPDEIDPGSGHISIDAPLARALLGRQVEEEVEVVLPEGVARYLIISIRYETQA